MKMLIGKFRKCFDQFLNTFTPTSELSSTTDLLEDNPLEYVCKVSSNCCHVNESDEFFNENKKTEEIFIETFYRFERHNNSPSYEFYLSKKALKSKELRPCKTVREEYGKT